MLQFQSSARAIRHAFALLCALGLSNPAQALDMEFFDGDVYVTVSHALTYGINVATERVNDQIVYGGERLPAPVSGGDPACGPNADDPLTPGDQSTPRTAPEYNQNRLACSNGGLNTAPNDDAGHLAFKRGVYANQFKGTTDARVSWGEFTAFTRLLYFYDWEIMNQSREEHPSEHYEELTGSSKQDYGFSSRYELDSNAEEEIGQDIRTLDAYVAWETYIGDRPLTIRVGDQVINWGQSTFLPGIAVTNPVDLNRLFAPGFELQELFKPVGLVFASFGLTENIALEAYYQYDYEPVVLPPGGSFFAVNNYTGAGVNDAGQGTVCLDGSPTNLGFADDFDNDGLDDIGGGLGGFCVNNSPTEFPDNGDEFGIRVQVTLPWLNYTQLDFYAIRYHSRLPHVGAITAGLIPNAGDLACAAISGAIAGGAPCRAASARVPEFPSVAVKYLPDLWAYGFSFSGNIPGGWTMQGEISYKKDMPMQVSLPELIGVAGWLSIDIPGSNLNALGGIPIVGPVDTIDCSLREVDQLATCQGVDLSSVATSGDVNLPTGLTCDPAKGEDCDPECPRYAAQTNGNCAYNLGATVAKTGDAQGYQALDFVQAQVTFLKLFPQMFGGDTMIFLAEVLGVKVMDMPGVSEIMFEKTDFSDQNNRKLSHAEDFGWAYRILIRNEYTNLFGTSWAVSPTLVWFHDVNGSPPANSGTFLEDRKQAILVFPFTYQNKYTISFKYAWFGGAPQSNIFNDRDSFSLTFSTTL